MTPPVVITIPVELIIFAAIAILMTLGAIVAVFFRHIQAWYLFRFTKPPTSVREYDKLLRRDGSIWYADRDCSDPAVMLRSHITRDVCQLDTDYLTGLRRLEK